MAFRQGYDLGATFKLDGAGTATTLNITAWSWAEEVMKLVTTHTGSAGIQAVLAGILDGEGSVEANVDIAALPNAAAPGIIAGAKGTITFNTGTSVVYSIHVMVTQVPWKSSVNGLLQYSFNVTLDSTTGTYVRP